MKKFSILAVAVIMIAAMFLTACTGENGIISVDQEKDNQQVVATVDGVDITKGEVIDYLKMAVALQGYSVDELFAEGMEDTLSDMMIQAKDMLVQQTSLETKAEEFDLTDFTEEEMDAIIEEVQMFLDQSKMSIDSQLMQETQAQGTTLEGEAFEEESQRRYDEWLAAFGGNQDMLIENFVESEILLRLQDYVFEDIDVSEEEVKALYDVSLEEQTTAMSEDPTMQSMYEQMGSIIVYRPSDVYNVRHILIDFYEYDESGTPVEMAEEDQAAIDDANSKYGLAESDAERAAALALLTPFYEKIQPTVDKVAAKLSAGEDFVTLMNDYGKDPGMTYYPEGYPVVADAGEFMPEFEKAATSLTESLQVSAPIKTVYGVHFIQLIGIDKVGPIDYEEVKELIRQQLLNEEKEKAWLESETLWMDSVDLVEYPNRLK